MFIDNIETLKKLDYNKQLGFAYLACERLYPNYTYFSDNHGFGDKNALRDAIDFIRDNLFIQISNENPSVLSHLKAVDLNTPLPRDFDTILGSSALDACNAILETLDFMVDKNASRLNDISTFATDTVHMYIEDKYNLDYNIDKEFKQKIFNHSLMQKEIAVQKGIITYLTKITKIEPLDIRNLLDLQNNNKKSNIDLPCNI